MSKALIEKARECVCEKCMDKDSCFRENNCPDIQTFIAGASWQREQLEAEIKEAREIIKYTLGIIDGYNKNDSESGFGGHTYNCTNCPVDKCYENKQCWFDVIKGRGQQFIAKLDLLEKGGE